MTMGTLDEPTLASIAALPAPVRAPVALPTGYLLAGRYRIEAMIGVGGMATVFSGRDLALRRAVAIKVFGPAVDDLNLPGIDDCATRVDREIRLHARLRHVGLVQLFDAHQPEPDPHGAGPGGTVEDPAPWGYLVLELATGGTLAEALRTDPRPVGGPVDARALAVDLIDALGYLHERGIAHCDIKPSNVVFAADGQAKLIDLGIAVDASAPRAQIPSGWLAGTARYASPEQLRGLALTTATDIYSLALVLLDVLAGPRSVPPTALPVVDVVPASVPDSVGPQWFWLLTAMLSPDPARRPSAADVAAVLRRMDPALSA